MDQSTVLEQMGYWLALFMAWLLEDVLIVETGIEAGIVAAAFVAAYFAAKPINSWLIALRDKVFTSSRWRPLFQIIKAVADLTLPIVWAFLQFLTTFIFRQIDFSYGLLTITTNLLTAWIVIRLVTHFVENPAFSRIIAVTAWTIAALNIVGYLDETSAFLESLSFSLGTMNISALAIINSIITLVIFLWAAGFASGLIDQQMRNATSLTPSIRVLVSNLSRITLIIIAILVALGGAGIDLTALTVFSGAVGIGVGFGLQKIISNFISGIILLLDKSVKPGDNIALGTTFGWIDKLNARYVSVITRDGTEHLIPNEELIINRVENWSYSSNLLRLRIPIGISYRSDVRKAIELCKEAAAECQRIVEDPPPNCLLRGFGDSSVDLEIRVWITDPQNGRGNITSECLLKVWDLFHEHAIEIPFPQRDLHIKSADAIIRTQLDNGLLDSRNVLTDAAHDQL